MQLIKTLIHPTLLTLEGNTFHRISARGIILKGDEILLLYTKRYDDYTFPGGGLDVEEDITDCLIRELQEEVGADSVQIKSNYGYTEDYRPYQKGSYQIMHTVSHFFICEIADKLKEVKMEDYEIRNGMIPKWISIYEAIAHNLSVMNLQRDSIGLSIQRETYMLEKIASELVYATKSLVGSEI